MGKRILIATRTPEGLPGGSGFHLRNMIECLEKSGHQIKILHLDNGGYDEPPPYIYHTDFGNEIRQYQPDVMIADYSWMTPCLDIAHDGVLKICFVHDLRCRIVPCLTAIGYQDKQNWTEEKEADLLRKADVLLVLNDDDAAFCRRMAPEAKVIRVGIAMKPVEYDPAKEVAGRCIYVGSNNMENAHALNWLGEHVWPRVLQEVSYATLDVVTGHPDNLGERYAEAQIAVVPHIMKGGLKLKTAEAFAHGLPVVGNVCAFDGFDIDDGFATDDPKEMSEYIVTLLRDDDYRMGTEETRVMKPIIAYDGLLEALCP